MYQSNPSYCVQFSIYLGVLQATAIARTKYFKRCRMYRPTVLEYQNICGAQRYSINSKQHERETIRLQQYSDHRMRPMGCVPRSVGDGDQGHLVLSNF